MNSLKSILPAPLYRFVCRSYDRMRAAMTFLAHQGFGRRCPFCEMTFRKFIRDVSDTSPLFAEEHVIGGPCFPEAICPFCGSFERERHVYLYLLHATDLFTRPVKLLHIAPESRLRRVLMRQKNVQYVSADLASPMARVKMDITKMPFVDGAFDVVICNHVLEHIPEDWKAMQELRRVLLPGGWAMLQVPIATGRATTDEDPTVALPAERLRRFGQFDHVRIYGRDYPQRLADAGFEVAVDDRIVHRGEAYVRRYGLIPDEGIYIATKPVSASPVRSAVSANVSSTAGQ